ITPASGGGAISADTAGGAYTSLTGPSYLEPASGSAGLGTIILNAPAGFIFDTGGTPPTVLLTGSADNTKNINNAASGAALAMSSVTSSQLSFTVSSKSTGNSPNRLTWQN